MIKLDLRDLTPEMVQQVLPNMGMCMYAAPCIIGALMRPADRLLMDKIVQEYTYCGESLPVCNLVSLGKITFPDEEQLGLAIDLQDVFDNSPFMSYEDLQPILEKIYKLKETT